MTSPPKRLLIVDDNIDTREILQLQLASEGFEGLTAGTAEEALSLIRQAVFDAIILDNWMPDMSGVELCQKMREFDASTPIVFHSAAAFDSDKQHALRSGAQAYVVKPVDMHLLAETLHSVIASRNKALDHIGASSRVSLNTK